MKIQNCSYFLSRIVNKKFLLLTFNQIPGLSSPSYRLGPAILSINLPLIFTKYYVKWYTSNMPYGQQYIMLRTISYLKMLSNQVGFFFLCSRYQGVFFQNALQNSTLVLGSIYCHIYIYIHEYVCYHYRVNNSIKILNLL